MAARSRGERGGERRVSSLSRYLWRRARVLVGNCGSLEGISGALESICGVLEGIFDAVEGICGARGQK